MSNQKAVRDERIERVRVALLNLALEHPRASFTLKELSQVTHIPYGSIRGVLEHRDCWNHIRWTQKEVPVRESSYKTITHYRMVDSVMADEWVLVNEIKRLRALAKFHGRLEEGEPS